MSERVRILFLEDNAADFELVSEFLASEALNCEIVRAKNRADFEQSLESASVDLILSDYAIPGYSGFAALPNVVMIDGGRGQLSSGLRALRGFRDRGVAVLLDVDRVALDARRERKERAPCGGRADLVPAEVDEIRDIPRGDRREELLVVEGAVRRGDTPADGFLGDRVARLRNVVAVRAEAHDRQVRGGRRARAGTFIRLRIGQAHRDGNREGCGYGRE